MTEEGTSQVRHTCWNSDADQNDDEKDKKSRSETTMMNDDDDGAGTLKNEEEKLICNIKADRVEEGETSKILDEDEDHEEECGALDGGWSYVVLFGTFIIMNTFGIIVTCYGILFLGLFNEFGTSSAVVAGIYNVECFIRGLTQLFVGPLTEEFGWRRVTMVGAILVSAGVALSAFAPSASFLFFSYSLLTGVGTGFCLILAYAILPHYFKRLRGRANAVMTAGFCISGIVGPPVFIFLQGEYGFRGTLLITAAIMLHTCVAASVFHPVAWHNKKMNAKAKALNRQRRCPELVVKMELKKLNGNDENKTVDRVDGRESRSNYLSEVSPREIQIVGSKVENKLAASPDITKLREEKFTRSSTKKLSWKIRMKDMFLILIRNLKLFRSPTTIIISISVALLVVGCSNFTLMVPFIMEARGYSLQDTVWGISVLSFCNLVARLVVSSLSDFPGFSLQWVYVAGLATITTAGFGFAFVDGLVWVAVMLGGFGFGWGTCMSLFPLLLVQCMGIGNYIAALGISGTLYGTWFLTAGPLVGLVRDVSGSYTVTVCVLISTILIAIIIVLFLPTAMKYEKRKRKAEREKRRKTTVKENLKTK